MRLPVLLLPLLAAPLAAQTVPEGPRSSVLFAASTTSAATAEPDPGFTPYSWRKALIGGGLGAGAGALLAYATNAGAVTCEDVSCDDNVATGHLLAYAVTGAIFGYIVGGRMGTPRNPE